METAAAADLPDSSTTTVSTISTSRSFDAAFPASRLFTIGYVLNPKKTLTFDSRGLFSHPLHARTAFVPIDLSAPLERQGPFDVLLVKLTDSMTRARYHSDAAAHAQVEQVRRYAAEHRDCVLIDDLQAVERLLDRATVSAMIDAAEIEEAGWRLCCPPSVSLTLPSPELPDAAAAALAVPFAFPVLCKHRQSCGSPSSHIFRLLSSPSQLAALPAASASYFIQQLVPHSGTMYKVYVLGNEAFIVPRPSLPPSITQQQQEQPDCSSSPPLIFDSQRMTVTADDGSSLSLLSASSLQPVDEELKRVVDAVSPRLAAVVGLSLFGYDVIIPSADWASCCCRSRCRCLVVVDVNYFPSYNQVEGLSARLLHSISQTYTKEMQRRRTTREDAESPPETHAHAAAPSPS